MENQKFSKLPYWALLFTFVIPALLLPSTGNLPFNNDAWQAAIYSQFGSAAIGKIMAIVSLHYKWRSTPGMIAAGLVLVGPLVLFGTIPLLLFRNTPWPSLCVLAYLISLCVLFAGRGRVGLWGMAGATVVALLGIGAMGLLLWAIIQMSRF